MGDLLGEHEQFAEVVGSCRGFEGGEDSEHSGGNSGGIVRGKMLFGEEKLCRLGMLMRKSLVTWSTFGSFDS